MRNLNEFVTAEMPTVCERVRLSTVVREKYTPPIKTTNWKRHYRILWYGVQIPQHPFSKRFKAYFTKNCLPVYKIMVDICFRIEDGNRDKIKDFIEKYDDIKRVKTTPVHAKMFGSRKGRGKHGNKSNQGQHDDKTIRNDS